MSLTIEERRTLAALEESLRREAPELVGRFGVFTKLSASEPLPVHERVSPYRPLFRAKRSAEFPPEPAAGGHGTALRCCVWIVGALVILLLLVGGLWLLHDGAGGCGAGSPAKGGGTTTTHTVDCQGSHDHVPADNGHR